MKKFRVLKGTVIQGIGVVEVGEEFDLEAHVARPLVLMGRLEEVPVVIEELNVEAPETATDEASENAVNEADEVAVVEAPETATSRGRRRQ